MTKLDDLVKEFAVCVEEQGKAIQEANVAKGNKYARRYSAIFDEIRQHGDIGRNALERLFEHPQAVVRTAAAAFLLRHSGSKAIKVLKAEAKKQGIAAFRAEQALLRWEEGNWNLDPPHEP